MFAMIALIDILGRQKEIKSENLHNKLCKRTLHYVWCSEVGSDAETFLQTLIETRTGFLEKSYVNKMNNLEGAFY